MMSEFESVVSADRPPRHRSSRVSPAGQEIGRRLNEEMIRQNIGSKLQLAKMIGIPATSLGNYLAGVYPQSIINVNKIRKFLGDQSIPGVEPPTLPVAHTTDSLVPAPSGMPNGMLAEVIEKVEEVTFRLSWLVYVASQEDRVRFRDQMGKNLERFLGLARAITNEMMRERVLSENLSLTNGVVNANG